jgi:hypothetical protein
MLNKIIEENVAQLITQLVWDNLFSQISKTFINTLENLNNSLQVHPDMFLKILVISLDDLEDDIAWVLNITLFQIIRKLIWLWYVFCIARGTRLQERRRPYSILPILVSMLILIHSLLHLVERFNTRIVNEPCALRTILVH